MSELNFGHILRRARLFATETAILDLESDYQATYSEHLNRVGRLCAVLSDMGLTGSDRMAVLADASHVYIELWHAALAGAAVINPLNSRLAPRELEYILKDSATEVLFVDSNYAGVIDGIRDQLPHLRQVVLIGDGDVPCNGRLEDMMSQQKSSALPSEPVDSAPAVLMYTGGTTGLPKGVVLTQRAVALVLYRMLISMRPNPRGIFLSCLPMFHIGSIAAWGLYAPSGGQTIIMPAFEAGKVNRVIRDHGVTRIGLVPTMLNMMTQHPDFETDMLNSLEAVTYGAAPMPPRLLAYLLETYPDLSFFQLYGMTECASTVTALLPEDHLPGSDLLSSVGRPCIGVELDIRNPETDMPLEQGEIGEVWVRCESTMLEYWQKPEQTANSLVDDWYRTGDAGHVDENGYLFLADRVKDMIVSGGENIYSIEVENAISSHPAVREVAVVAVPDDRWSERVHAVVVCDPDAVSEQELDSHARESIAGYKVPRSWSFQQEPLPLSAAGKVLKRELRQRQLVHDGSS